MSFRFCIGMVGLEVSAGRFAKPLRTEGWAETLEAHANVVAANCRSLGDYQIPLLVCMLLEKKGGQSRALCAMCRLDYG